jgi:hypothetical protein
MPDVTRVIENADVRFLNFAGVQGRFNAPGKRNFCIFLSEELAAEMVAENWKVKYLQGREDMPRQPYIQVAVSYAGKRPPKVMLINSRGKRELPEDLVDLVDETEIKKVDVIIRQYAWEVQGNRGIKAYLKTFVLEVLEDYLELKYAHVNDIELGDPVEHAIEDIIDVESWEDPPRLMIGA